MYSIRRAVNVLELYIIPEKELFPSPFPSVLRFILQMSK